MDLSTLFLHAVPYGLGISVFLSIVLLGGMWNNPEVMLHDYPPDIKAAYGPLRNPDSRRQGVWMGILMFLVLIVGLLMALISLPRPSGFGQAYLYGLVTLWTAMMTFNLFDLLVLDIPLVYIKPKRLVLPGTEGLKGYSDAMFHVRGFFKGTLGITLVSLVLALIPAGLWLLL